MNTKKQLNKRRKAYDEPFAWHWGRIKKEIEIKGKTEEHPGCKTVIFLVHGIGQQDHAETAAQLRSGFEDAYKKISDWQEWARENGPEDEKKWLDGLPGPVDLPPPYISEGFWADYPEIEKNFKEDCDKFRTNELSFFKKLWKKRLFSVSGTYFWFLGQQLRLLHPKVIFDVGFLAWLTYFPLQINSFVALTLTLFTDVRLYLRPKGIVERAIVQRIDKRVGERFLQLIGLDWDFKSLPNVKLMNVVGEKIVFDRVIWVAHSLGTIISYNVLSDLFYRIEEIKMDPKCTYDQRDGIKKFKKSLRRFITMGSPIDKIAYLYKDKVLRAWHTNDRESLLNGGEVWEYRYDKDKKEKDKINKEGLKREWWFNYYHAFDPVSGALNNEDLFGDNPPVNRHIKWCYFPGWAHVAYWKDSKALRFILTRAYGSVMWDKAEKPLPGSALTILAIIAQLLPIALAIGIICIFYNWGDIWGFIQSIQDLFKIFA
jgi:hypothetical protein